MVLAMFVDSGRAELLRLLAGGRDIVLPPSILEAQEWPLVPGTEPRSDFVRGMAYFQGDQGPQRETLQQRLERRTAFLQNASALWQPADLSLAEVRLAYRLTTPAKRAEARAIAPGGRVARVDQGEAECAAVAILRGGSVWSDDSGIVPMLRALYSEVTVERSCALVARAINTRLLSAHEGVEFFEIHVKEGLGIRSRAVLKVRGDGTAECVMPN